VHNNTVVATLAVAACVAATPLSSTCAQLMIDLTGILLLCRSLDEEATAPGCRSMLRGELAYRRGDYAAAWQLLREAVELDDALAYTHRAAGVEFSQSEL
jgi:hypothetical protein